MVRFCSRAYDAASLPANVVFPTPFTPTSSATQGFSGPGSNAARAPDNTSTAAASSAPRRSRAASCCRRFFASAIRWSVVAGPTSAASSAVSSASTVAGSTLRWPRAAPSAPVNAVRVRSSPRRKRSHRFMRSGSVDGLKTRAAVPGGTARAWIAFPAGSAGGHLGGLATGRVTHVHAIEVHRVQLRHAQLLHGDAVDAAGRLHGLLVVRDHHELRLVAEAAEQVQEPLHVRVVERRIDFVQQAERGRLHQVDREQQRDRGERPLAARHQRDALEVLPARLRDDLDLGFHRILAQHAQLAVAALEQRLEDVLEVRVHLLERLAEQLRRGDVDLLDGLEQLRLGLVHVLTLLGEEREALLLAAVLLEREQVHGADALEPRARLLESRRGFLRRQVLGQRGGGERLGCDGVLGLQALERAIQLGARLDTIQLERVQPLGQLGLLEAQVACLLVERAHLFLQLVERLLQLDHALALRALGLEQPGKPGGEPVHLGLEPGNAAAVLLALGGARGDAGGQLLYGLLEARPLRLQLAAHARELQQL